MPRRPKSESRWGGPGLALAALLAGAAALRLVGVQYGLPFALLNTDERSIVPRAWRMTHGGSLDPGWYDYPTLVMYLLAPFQAWQEAPSYLTGRLPVVAVGVAAVAASWWLGARAYGTVAGFVAGAVVAVETTHVAYSRMSVTDVPLTLGVAAALALLVGRRLELAGLAIGLATAAKYPGIFLLAPLLVAGWGRWPRLALSVALAGGAFLAASPFVAIHTGEAAGDAFRVQELAREGWLGFENDHAAPIAFADRLWEGMGPALIVAGIGLVAALAMRGRADGVLAAFVLVYFANLLTLDAHFDRYVLPLVPALGALAGRFRSLAPVTLLLLVVPLTWTIREDRRLTRTDTRAAAHAWIERNVPAGEAIAAEPDAPSFRRHRLVRLQLPGPGRDFDERRDLTRLREDAIHYVLITGDVAGRVLAARDHYPLEIRFYESLERDARRIYHLDPGDRFAGPWVTVYRL